MTLQLAGTWEGHNQGLLTLAVVRRTCSSYLFYPDKTKVHGAWQTVWRLHKEREECATLHSKHRMAEMWSCGRLWDLYWHAQKQIWQNWQRKSKSVNTERALVHRRWPKSPAFPLFPFKYLLLWPLGEQWCKRRRTFRYFQLVMVPSSEDKALNEKSTAQTNPRNPAFSSCSAVLATALNYSLIVSFS